MVSKKCPFCQEKAEQVDAEISPGQQVRLIFCCRRCDRSFSEVYEYAQAEDAEGNPLEEE